MFGKESNRTMWVCLALIAGTALIYWPVLTFDFVNFDDPRYILNNFHINTGLSWRGFLWSFQAGYSSNWHPLTWMSHMLDCQLFHRNPAGHHATNVLFHIVNSVLLFLLLQRMTKTFWRSAMVAALFAWHPLHVESVAWISERKDVLSAFFWMLSIGAYLNYAEKGGARRYLLVLLLFMLGLMSKPMVITLPCVLLLLDWWPLKRFQVQLPARKSKGEEDPDAAKPYQLLILEKVPFFLLIVGVSILTVIAQKRGGAVSSLNHVTLMARFYTALTSYFRYTIKLIWPTDMAVIYPFQYSWALWEIIAAAILILSVSGVAIWFRRTRPYYLFGWLWFLGTLVPVSGIMQVGAQSTADRFTYIPSIGLFIMVCWVAYDLVHRWSWHPKVLWAMSIALLAASGIATGVQLQYWRNAGTLFMHALEVTPDNFIAHTSYASYLRDMHQLEKARQQCEISLKIAPLYAIGHSFLGGILVQQGKFDEAAAEFRTGLELKPDQIEARRDLGEILMRKKDLDGAVTEFTTALSYDNTDPGVHFVLGKALALQGKLDEAQKQFIETMRITPEYPDAHYQLALTLSMQNKIKESIAEYEMALKLQPNFPDVLNNLAWIRAANARAEFRNGNEAVKLASRACTLTRNREAIMIGTLAAAYAEAGRFTNAIASAQLAHDVAVANGEKDRAARNLELLETYKAHKAFHETAQ